MRSILGCAALLGLAGFVALAPNSAAQDDRGGPSDAEFVQKAAAGGLAEVNLSLLAPTRAKSAEVKTFAKQMVDDHGKANQELINLANRKGWTLPTTEDAKHKAVWNKLKGLAGDRFDHAYSDQMVKDHEMTVSLFSSESKNGRDRDLRAWAGKTLPTLRHHLDMAHKLPGQHDRDRGDGDRDRDRDRDHHDKDKGGKDRGDRDLDKDKGSKDRHDTDKGTTDKGSRDKGGKDKDR